MQGVTDLVGLPGVADRGDALLQGSQQSKKAKENWASAPTSGHLSRAWQFHALLSRVYNYLYVNELCRWPDLATTVDAPLAPHTHPHTTVHRELLHLGDISSDGYRPLAPR